ncbi:hypothetical protein D9547_13385 [Geobacillus stearothermophilus]|uniref:Uncharacterized protein n=1 Tax=Geobacillus stearothermophilus TaxID=1422 RepID=A0A3L7BYD5_GEOSE|nr:hypothetical protein [Geobacillus sp. DSP4a]RLP97953.1 hypothetical protein D9545_13630 [Geobacillus stearothermophilus]RLQ05791.1 hypothetical protein D9549_14020 [Geobacillus stearothermophilus]RLQ06796.1 hypothetical protein D9547_13385 [Geobacillus stearothermophilus]RLQ13049.1 hypothetical protein D9548_13970 [Geobacillus stearothermophilus]
MREKLLHFPCVSRIHSTSERKNPPDFRRKGAKCEVEINIMNEGTKKGFDALPKGCTGAYHEKHGS